MNLFKEYFVSQTKHRYMQVGFSEDEADAMSWIAKQKAQGRLIGTVSGLFLAATWGHWHDRILLHFRFHFSRRITQFSILLGTIIACDYLYTSRRTGANQVIANRLKLNTNLLNANLDSLIENFSVYPDKFNDDQIQSFNSRVKLLKTNHHKIQNKKWIYNSQIYKPEEFLDKLSTIMVSPWIPTNKPSNISKLIDETGEALGIPMAFSSGWRQL